MPYEILSSEQVAELSGNLVDKIKFTPIGVDICSTCQAPEFIVEASRNLYNSDMVQITNWLGHNLCFQCIHREIERYIRFTSLDSVSELVATYMQVALHDLKELGRAVRLSYEGNFCAACLLPEYEQVDAWVLSHFVMIDNGEKAMVHRNCYNRATRCNACATSHLRDTTDSNKRMFYNFGWAQNVPYMPEYNDRPYCEPCRDEIMENGDYSVCVQCENIYSENNVSSFNGDDYCNSCYENNIYECDYCGDSYHTDNGCNCDGDDDYNSNSVIHSYSYKPSTEFFGSNDDTSYYLGFELEVECRRNDRYDQAEAVQKVLGARAYMKDDGSLNNGFEVVTHPHSLEEYNSPDFNWGFLETLKRGGVTSWNTSTCGLHIHVSRTAFNNVRLPYNTSAMVLARQAHELRFMKLIYDNQRQVERIAGRANNHYSSFADKGKLVGKVKYGRQENDRYSAINTENSATLEVRVFRGSLRPERVRSAIEFVHAAVEYTRDLKVTSKNNALSWSKFITFVVRNEDTYPNLMTIINETLANEAINDGNNN